MLANNAIQDERDWEECMAHRKSRGMIKIIDM
jgi:hypothetical protein